jgi:hypothetical protein
VQAVFITKNEVVQRQGANFIIRPCFCFEEEKKRVKRGLSEKAPISHIPVLSTESPLMSRGG